ncbi:MAG: C13 family peptidase, partial [Candidatus Thorarchaeota archaeon]
SPFGNPVGSLNVNTTVPTPVSGNFSLDYSEHYDLLEYALYNITVEVFIQSDIPLIGTGTRIGLQWLNSTGTTVRVDWTDGVTNITNTWFSMNLTGVCNNETNNEITDLNLVLSVEASFPEFINNAVYFDNIKIDKWISVNVTNPLEPPPSPGGINSDGFPAQALQVYWILKNHGYTDDNIFFMLYWKNDIDGLVNIDRNDGILNDVVGAVIDVLDDDVNASRFKLELNASISGSFASGVDYNDKLIIFMSDHGSNKVLGDGNATFHFEADHSFITEFEFYNLVKGLAYDRLMINIDCCFSGNFLNKDKNIGVSWYDIPNSILVSAASNVLSWYWINNANGDGWAGSWFFHVFWDKLDKNETINSAFNTAFNFSPFKQGALNIVQNPLMHDNMGINTTLSFNSDPPL